MLKNLAKTLAVVVSSTVLATLAVQAVDLRDPYYRTMLSGMAYSTQVPSGTSCPEHMVYVAQALKPFCIDKYEASPSRACTYADPKNADESSINLSNTKCTPESHAQRVPWRNLTQEQAQRACAQVGKRLPTPNEWFVAAFGTPDQKDDWNEEQCNVANNRAQGVSKTGSGMRCVSSLGAYDMVGNVWEWVEGTVAHGVYNDVELPPTGFVTGTQLNGLAYTTGTAKDANYFNDRFWSDASIVAGIMRGGYYGSQEYAGIYATYAASPVTFSGEALGFRCAVTIDNS